MSSKVDSKEEEDEVVFRCDVVEKSVVGDVLRSRKGWREIEPENDSPENFDFNWTPSKTVKTYFDGFPTSNHHVINHFKNPFELTRKDLMIKNVKRKRRSLIRLGMKDEAEKFGRICPHSFVLPQDYNLFVEAFKREAPGQMWIMKPVGRSQGKGIFLFHSLHQIAGWKRGNDIQNMMSKNKAAEVESYVAQKYIANPHLVGGKKYDMRIYVLVTSYSPLVAWLYRDGFARFCISRYSKKREDMNKIHMHLTNNAIQKKADGYGASGVKDCKLPLQSLKLHIASKRGADVADRVFGDIEDIIVRSLISVQKAMVQDPNCFELYVSHEEDISIYLKRSLSSQTHTHTYNTPHIDTDMTSCSTTIFDLGFWKQTLNPHSVLRVWTITN